VLHAAVLGIVLLLSSRSIPLRRALPRDATRLIAPLKWRPARDAPERSGGSSQTLLPARKGAPPPTGPRTFIPPKTLPDPKLPMAITVAFDSPVIQIDPASIGDPSSALRNGALGYNGGIGNGNGPPGPGIGPGGSGPAGIRSNSLGAKITPPELIYKEEPEFSEQARKAKYQGTVLLAIEVDLNGHPRNVRVVRGLGLGLDEKAIEAVSHWLFRPGIQNGKPVVTAATVEVNFRLL
jgi:periplasmic protein TonB